MTPVDPGRKEWSAAAGLLYTGVQIMNPGASTSAHRHQASVLRFVMEGKGAFTEHGERMELGARDFVLTPNDTWHDDGVDEDGTQCVWQDGLDIPLDEFWMRISSKCTRRPCRARAAVARKLEEALFADVPVQVGFVLFRTEKAQITSNTEIR